MAATDKVQILRSNIAGHRPPAGHQPGELYVNWPDSQFGVVNGLNNNQDLIAVRFFSNLTSYNVGDHVVNSGNIYKASVTVPPGTFNPLQWIMISPQISMSAAPPPNPIQGQLWWGSNDGQLYVYYNDGNSSQWVVANNFNGGAYLPLLGGTITGQVNINQPSNSILALAPTSGNASINLQKAATGFANQILGYTATLPRWLMQFGSVGAESGGNVGSDFIIGRYNDAGNFIDAPLTITRSTGNVSVANPPVASNDVATKGYVDTSSIILGEIRMYAGTSPPTNWTGCWGQALSAAQYPGLFAVIGHTYGGSGDSFNLPLLNGRVPVGYDGGGYTMGLMAGEVNHQLGWGEMPSHVHGVGDPTHAHSVADPGHSHYLNDPGHAHGASQPAHNHSYSQWGSATTPVYAQATYYQGLVNATTGTSQPGVSVGGSGTGQWMNAAGVGIGIYGAGTGIWIGSAGADGAHNNMQPYTVLMFIIRYQ
jgi:microcystin-dependent protein